MAEDGEVPQRSARDSKHEIGVPVARRVGLPGEAPPTPPLTPSPTFRLEDLDLGTRSYLRAPAAPATPPAPAGGARESAPAEPAETAPAVAVLVVHGMGQQIPFETLDQVEGGLRRMEEQRTGTPVAAQPRSFARSVLLGDQPLERLELPLQGGHRPVSVHLYEAYWAPLTEGKVTMRDVLGFLLDGGLNGLRKSRESFWRWMFDRRVDFGRQRTAFKLLLALGVVGVLVLVNALVTAVAAALVAAGAGSWLTSEYLLSDLTLAIVALLVALGACAALAWTTKRMVFFYLALLAMLAFGVSTLGILAWHRLSGTTPWPHLLHGRMGKAIFVAVWLALLWLTGTVRTLLIQYMGDVAAYVSPQKLDRFTELRAQIKDVVGKTAKAVYGALSADGRSFEYQDVIVVAHSLGSVVAYDTLNALINWDILNGERLEVVSRTRLFLTFGSPLEKTAFLFANQSRKTTESREALAAAVQPLIQDYKFRRFPWINVHSPKDIISGVLRFYDDVKNPHGMDGGGMTAAAAKARFAGASAAGPAAGLRVDNREDPAATTPVYAHVQYWKNDRVFAELYGAL